MSIRPVIAYQKARASHQCGATLDGESVGKLDVDQADVENIYAELERHSPYLQTLIKQNTAIKQLRKQLDALTTEQNRTMTIMREDITRLQDHSVVEPRYNLFQDQVRTKLTSLQSQIDDLASKQTATQETLARIESTLLEHAQLHDEQASTNMSVQLQLEKLAGVK